MINYYTDHCRSHARRAFRFICLVEIIILLLITLFPNIDSAEEVDRWSQFLTRLQKSDVAYCPDKTKLLPDCKECIPGLQIPRDKQSKGDGMGECSEFIPSSKKIIDEIGQLTKTRYAGKIKASRPYGLYPYLESPDFLVRQKIFGEMLSQKNAANILDIGAYYNPINLFLQSGHCPNSVVIVEPILQATSAYVPCEGGKGKTHIVILPVTFFYFRSVKKMVPRPDSVVCIGCDSVYGPNRNMLETTFERPFTLYLEYPSEYHHNGPFRKMMGTEPGEKLTFIKKIQPQTNETQYVKRVFKVIEYSPV